jgi:NADH-quinone oxidoreductase subunit M
MFYGKYAVRNSLIELSDIDRREYSMLLPLAVAVVIFGVFPQLLLNYINPFATDFIGTWFSFENFITP